MHGGYGKLALRLVVVALKKETEQRILLSMGALTVLEATLIVKLAIQTPAQVILVILLLNSYKTCFYNSS